MKLSRTWALTDIVVRAHILNPFWRSRVARRDRRCDVAARAIPQYLKRYVPAPGTVPETTPIHDDKNEKIFTIWLQGEENAPELVRACFRSIRKNCTQELVVLDEKTLWDYIRLPDVIMEKRRRGQIKNAHFADICRVELLYQHGGIWLDSTGFATAPIPKWIIDQDFFVYMAGTKVGQAYSYMQNCFIRARRGAYLLAAWRQTILNFWMNEPREFDYFMHQLMFKALIQNDPVARKYFDAMPHVDQDPTHAVWWTIACEPFSQKLFDEYTSGAFFQKTTYNSPYAKNPIPGSVADVMINKMYKD
ncbi:MAG: capsular polysaccharide synthesis protein [Alphaproteobacteria bacterium]|nr:capsular polysaccharide synthesis protein [Alphaproteobacteria bacterium]MDE6570669.1 capsular polysaccharide synthesis protein [Alphaproteobacteria bacterium]